MNSDIINFVDAIVDVVSSHNSNQQCEAYKLLLISHYSARAPGEINKSNTHTDAASLGNIVHTLPGIASFIRNNDLCRLRLTHRQFQITFAVSQRPCLWCSHRRQNVWNRSLSLIRKICPQRKIALIQTVDYESATPFHDPKWTSGHARTM